MRQNVLRGLLGAVLCGGGWFLLEATVPEGARDVRSFYLIQSVTLNGAAGSGKGVALWVPVPLQAGYQESELVDIESPWKHEEVKDADFGNAVLYFEGRLKSGQENRITVTHRVTRRERGGDGAGDAPGEIYLQPRGLVVINREVRKIARTATRGIEDPVAKARAIYDYVFDHMAYDKSGEGWGHGDVVYACKVGKGNCTDFHSLFIALARAEGIPARFRIGVPVPREAGEKLISYHCWAEFHIEGKGWIPVDISEAWKHPEKKEYFFGTLDADRVDLSFGREIVLPGQKGKPQNYFVRPYAEIGGKPFHDFDFERSYALLE